MSWEKLEEELIATMDMIDAKRLELSMTPFKAVIRSKVMYKMQRGEVETVQKALKLVKDRQVEKGYKYLSDKHKFWIFDKLAQEVRDQAEYPDFFIVENREPTEEFKDLIKNLNHKSGITAIRLDEVFLILKPKKIPRITPEVAIGLLKDCQL